MNIQILKTVRIVEGSQRDIRQGRFFPTGGTEKSPSEWNHVEGKGALKGEKKKAEPATIKGVYNKKHSKKSTEPRCEKCVFNEKRRGFR